MFSRREAMKRLGVTGGALALAPFAGHARADAGKDVDQPAPRFVFVVRSNGVLATEIQPEGLDRLVKTRANGGYEKKLHEHTLANRTLHKAMAALEPFKERVTILQGMSGKMCRGSHAAGFGALGAFASQSAIPRLETIDGALAKALGGVFPHLGFTMDNFGTLVTYPRLSALGPKKTLPFYADPMMAYRDLFGTVIQGAARAEVDIDRNVLDFMIDDVKRYQKRLPASQKEKLGHYLEGFESLRLRQKRLEAMKATLAKIAPELNDSYTSQIEIERVKAHFELAGSALIGGLSQVVTIRAEHMSMRLEGLGLGDKTVHGIGHMIEGQKGGNDGGPFADGKGEFATRAVIMDFHMQQIAKLAARLDAVPEGDGTMLDNTVILYLSDHGDRHHSKFYEWPMVAVGNVGKQFKVGRYIQVPGYGSVGHRTIASLYTSLLHAAGHPRDTFGQPDMSLEASIDQTGPLVEWMV